MEKTKQKKTWKKIVSDCVLAVVIVAILGICAVMFVGKLQNKPAFIGNKAAVWILTESMAEEIPPKTYILVEKITAEDVNVGDVIIFTSDDPELNGSLNTHRVVEIIGDNEEFVTKGDYNVVEDKVTAKADKVWGRYVKKLPTLTAMMRFFLTPNGLFITLAGFALISLALFLPDLVKGIRANKKQLAEENEAEIQRRVAEEVARLERENKNRKNTEEDRTTGEDES